MVKTVLQGILTDKFPQQPLTQTLVKRVFWLKEPDTEAQPQHWELELFNAECRRLDAFQVGDYLHAEVEVRGRRYEKQGKQNVYNSLKCLGLRKVGAENGRDSPSPFKD